MKIFFINSLFLLVIIVLFSFIPVISTFFIILGFNFLGNEIELFNYKYYLAGMSFYVAYRLLSANIEMKVEKGGLL